MSLVENITKYIEAQTSLKIDEDLFIGADVYNAPARCVIVGESAGAIETESGLERRPVQVICKDLAYLDAEDLAYEIYEIFAHKAGFPEGELDDTVLYCNVIGMPAPVDRDKRGSYIFTMTFLFIRGE